MTVELNQWGMPDDNDAVACVVLDDYLQPFGRAMARTVLNVLMVAVALPVVALLFVWFGVLQLRYFLYERWK